MGSGLTYYRRSEIADESWNAVVAASSAETLYAYSWYLDLVAPGWGALVMGDYQYVMPVIAARKYGIRHVYQPLYTQQLGVFSQGFTDPSVLSAMLAELRKRFRMGYLQFNARNLVSEADGFEVEDRLNYVLALNRPYEEIAEGFSQNARRNIRKASEGELELRCDLPVKELVALKRSNDVIARNEADYRWMTRVFEGICEKGAGECYGMYRGDELLAGVCFAFGQTRALYLLSASGEAGKELRAMFGLVDHFIRRHAGSDLLLDFEGSNIPSIARFFSGFGAETETYQGVRFNRLPRFINRLNESRR